MDKTHWSQVYIATCCAETHQRYSSQLTGRLAGMSPHVFSLGELRQTSLIDAVVDLYVCASSHFFKGSHGSSFSETIMHLRAHNRQERAHRLSPAAQPERNRQSALMVVPPENGSSPSTPT